MKKRAVSLFSFLFFFFLFIFNVSVRLRIKRALKHLVFSALQDAGNRSGKGLLVGNQVVLGVLQRGPLLRLAGALADPVFKKGF